MERWALAIVVLASCEGGSSPDPVEVLDRGRACLLGHEPAGSLRTTYPADQPVEIDVGSFACLSSSCTDEMVASCDVTVNGTSITITTRASWRDNGGTVCTDDCGSPSAVCMTPPLPAGTYTFTLGTQSTALVVPSMPPTFPCLGEEF